MPAHRRVQVRPSLASSEQGRHCRLCTYLLSMDLTSASLDRESKGFTPVHSSCCDTTSTSNKGYIMAPCLRYPALVSLFCSHRLLSTTMVICPTPKHLIAHIGCSSESSGDFEDWEILLQVQDESSPPFKLEPHEFTQEEMICTYCHEGHSKRGLV